MATGVTTLIRTAAGAEKRGRGDDEDASRHANRGDTETDSLGTYGVYLLLHMYCVTLWADKGHTSLGTSKVSPLVFSICRRSLATDSGRSRDGALLVLEQANLAHAVGRGAVEVSQGPQDGARGREAGRARARGAQHADRDAPLVCDAQTHRKESL